MPLTLELWLGRTPSCNGSKPTHGEPEQWGHDGDEVWDPVSKIPFELRGWGSRSVLRLLA